jgi:IS30 family transposase
MNERLRDMVARGSYGRTARPSRSPVGSKKAEYPEDEAMRVSHEAIYRTLFVQARGALKRELLAHLCALGG